MPECPSGKRIYGNERVASRAVTEAAKRGELPPMRHYICPECGHWHLSRKRRPPRRRDNG
jgi:hypothetical protein